MNRLIITCECGQTSRVPVTALGKLGECGGCGRRTRITEANTRPEQRQAATLPARQPYARRRAGRPGAGDVERFARALDLYHEGKYGEALAILNALVRTMPENQDLERVRLHCLDALCRRRIGSDMAAASPHGDALDAATVRRVVLEKMLYGATEADAIQLEAARLASEILGLRGQGQPPRDDHPAPPAELEYSDRLEDAVSPADEEGERPSNGGNGATSSAERDAGNKQSQADADSEGRGRADFAPFVDFD